MSKQHEFDTVFADEFRKRCNYPNQELARDEAFNAAIRECGDPRDISGYGQERREAEIRRIHWPLQDARDIVQRGRQNSGVIALKTAKVEWMLGTDR